VVPELLAVRDLDVVRPDALPEVVAALATDPTTRPALIDQVRVVAGRARADVIGHTAWWLRRELTQGAAAGPGAQRGLDLLLPPAPAWLSGLDPAVRAALGVVTRVEELDAAAIGQLLDRLADPAVPVEPGLLLRLLCRMAELARDGLSLPDPPEQVRAWSPSGTRVVSAGQACVLDAPMYRQRPDLGWPLPVPAALAGPLADLLDLPLASELAAGQIAEDGPAAGSRQALDPGLLDLLGRDLAGSVTHWCEHEQLLVDGVEVDWWVDDGGTAHAATLDGLARALASAAGRWELREVLSAVLLADPGDAGRVLAEALADEAFASGVPHRL
jgi:hypothetical protein